MQYYDSQQKALITIKRIPKYTKKQKKRYKQNRLNQLSLQQQNNLNKMTWLASYSKTNPDNVPIDQRDFIIKKQNEYNELIKNIQNLSSVINSLKSNNNKDYINTASQADLLNIEDILMADRSAVGGDVWDQAVIKNTKKQRLIALQKLNPEFQLFTAIDTDRPNLRPAFAKQLMGDDVDIITPTSVYNFLISEKGKEKFPNLQKDYPFIRESFETPVVTSEP